jgi:hypothetical protein
MKKLVLLALAAAVVLSIAAAPASARGGFDRFCGDQVGAMGAPWTSLKADNVSCRSARNLANIYTSAAYDPPFHNWKCREKQLGPEDLKVKCKRPKNGGQRLKFFWGA